MTKVFLAFSLVLGVVSTALAQEVICETQAARPSLGVGGEHVSMSAYVDPTVIEPAVNQTVKVAGGPEFSVVGNLPLSGNVGLRVDVGLNRFGVDSTVTTSNRRGFVSASVGQMSGTRVTAGVVRHSTTGRLFCGYAALTGGIYRFTYRGFSQTSQDLSATVGLRTQSRIGVFGEFGIDVIGAGNRPLMASVLLFPVRVGAGIVYQF